MGHNNYNVYIFLFHANRPRRALESTSKRVVAQTKGFKGFGAQMQRPNGQPIYGFFCYSLFGPLQAPILIPGVTEAFIQDRVSPSIEPRAAFTYSMRHFSARHRSPQVGRSSTERGVQSIRTGLYFQYVARVHCSVHRKLNTKISTVVITSYYLYLNFE